MKTNLLSIVAVLLISTATSAQTFKYSFETSEGFTVGDLNGQTPNIATINNDTGQHSGVAFVNTFLATDGTRSMKIPDGNSEVVFYNVPDYNKTKIIFDEYAPTVGDGAIEFTMSFNSTPVSIALYQNDISTYNDFDVAAGNSIGTYIGGQWYHFEINVDYTAHNLKISINGGAPFTVALQNADNAISAFNIATYAQGSDAYFDNIEVTNNAVLATSDQIKDPTFLVYPNPTSDFVHVKTDKKINLISVVDPSGKILKQSKLNTIDIQDLPKGIYFVNIKFIDQSEENTKLIKK